MGPDKKCGAFANQHRIDGVALFACLALLLVLSIAGTSAVRTSMLEARMVRNVEDALIALQAAESALSEGEAYLSDADGNATPFSESSPMFTNAGLNGLWTVAPPGQAERWTQGAIWTPESRGARIATTPIAAVARQPRYMVEWVATLPTTTGENRSDESLEAQFGMDELSGNDAFNHAADDALVPEEGGNEENHPVITERLAIFRITAWGVGRTESARSMVQSTYGLLIRDEGNCPNQLDNSNPDSMLGARAVLLSDATNCQSTIVPAPLGMVGLGRQSWREIAAPRR